MNHNPHGAVVFEERDERHPGFEDFLRFLQTVAPDQPQFVTGDHFASHASHLLVALDRDEVVGAIRFAVQPIGPEADCPALQLGGALLSEAKIHVFAVRPDHRNRGIGAALQRWVIGRARDLGCHQVASYSSYDKVANYHLKLSLGFAAQPEVHGDNEQGVYFLMPLRGAATDRRPSPSRAPGTR